jgi:hypothetical protein
VILRTVTLGLAGALLATPAAQAATPVVDQTDRAGDVVIYDGGGTKPTTGQRKSIDLLRLTVTRQGDGVRFTFRIARIVAGRTFDQVVEAQFVKPGRGGFELDVLANPQHKNGTAYVGDTACLIDVHTSRRTGTVRVDVPDACIPAGEGVLTAITNTVEKNGSGPGFSEDTMRVKGRVSLR